MGLVGSSSVSSKTNAITDPNDNYKGHIVDPNPDAPPIEWSRYALSTKGHREFFNASFRFHKFVGGDSHNVSFARCKLVGMTWKSCNMDQTVWNHCLFEGSLFDKVNFSRLNDILNSKLYGVDFRDSRGSLVLQNNVLHHCTFSGDYNWFRIVGNKTRMWQCRFPNTQVEEMAIRDVPLKELIFSENHWQGLSVKKFVVTPWATQAAVLVMGARADPQHLPWSLQCVQSTASLFYSK